MQKEFLLLNRRHSGNISLEQHKFGWQMGNLIYENTRRRLRGLSELDMDEYQKSRGVMWRLNDHRLRISMFHFRKAALSFASNDWSRLLPSLALSVALRPIHIPARVVSKIVLR